MQIKIHSKIKDYTLSFKEEFTFFHELAEVKPRIVIVDRNILKHYSVQLNAYFAKEELIPLDAVESNKNISSVLQLCDAVMKSSAKKNMTIISFGGGITQDVTGFLSSVLYRGINWIYVPTTLLAQSDSCMGSKTSLNHGHYKNLLGSFYPPSQVFINVNFTKTLTQIDFYSGLGEIVKLHLMGGKENIDSIITSVRSISSLRDNIVSLSGLVQNSLKIKYTYIKDDEFDTGKRNLLNYGHCFGHALEASSEYAIPHGIAVVIGIIFANLIAVKRGLLSQEKERFLFENLLHLCVKCKLKDDYFSGKSILSAMKMDKKRVGCGLPLIVLTDSFELSKLLDMTEEELFYGIDQLRNLLDLN